MAVIVDKCAHSEIFSTLERLGIEYFKSASLDVLYKPVNTHPDMQIHFVDNRTAVAAPSVFSYYKEILPKNISLHMGEKDPDGTYPGDCAYNVAKLGNKVIGNHSYVDAAIKKLYLQRGFEFVNTKQGYTKCNLCIVDENSVITEDAGLFKTLTECEIDALKIPSGEISLKGFDQGFIGGASGIILPKTIAFFGDIRKTSYYREIKAFLDRRELDIICLSQTKPSDFGSMLYFETDF